MSHAPSTLGTITTSSRSPISVTNVTRSSSTQGDSREFTRVHSGVPPSSVSRAARTSPARAASLRSAGIASSRLPSTMSAEAAIEPSRATSFSLDGSKKWIIRIGVTGISRTGSGAPTASGAKWERGLRIRAIMPRMSTVDTDGATREASGAHPYGRYLEEFEVGAVYKHWPAKTVTEADDHL